ncbi:MAG: AbrB/MazE/SpoVT family DNA-binding domain-containing protein [Methanosarcinales archaeon]
MHEEKGELLLKIPKKMARKMHLNPKDKVYIWIYENQIRIEKEKYQ